MEVVSLFTPINQNVLNMYQLRLLPDSEMDCQIYQGFHLAMVSALTQITIGSVQHLRPVPLRAG